MLPDRSRGKIPPMAKCWTTDSGRTRCGGRFAAVSGIQSSRRVRELTTMALSRFSGSFTPLWLAVRDIDVMLASTMHQWSDEVEVTCFDLGDSSSTGARGRASRSERTAGDLTEGREVNGSTPAGVPRRKGGQDLALGSTFLAHYPRADVHRTVPKDDTTIGFVLSQQTDGVTIGKDQIHQIQHQDITSRFGVDELTQFVHMVDVELAADREHDLSAPRAVNFQHRPSPMGLNAMPTPTGTARESTDKRRPAATRFRQWRNAGQPECQGCCGSRLRKRLLLIFSARILDSSVDRGIPRRAAAPEGPNTRPPAARSASSTSAFSCKASVRDSPSRFSTAG